MRPNETVGRVRAVLVYRIIQWRYKEDDDKKNREEKVKLVRDNSRCDRVQRVNLPSHSWRSTNPIVQGIAAR